MMNRQAPPCLAATQIIAVCADLPNLRKVVDLKFGEVVQRIGRINREDLSSFVSLDAQTFVMTNVKAHSIDNENDFTEDLLGFSNVGRLQLGFPLLLTAHHPHLLLDLITPFMFQKKKSESTFFGHLSIIMALVTFLGENRKFHRYNLKGKIYIRCAETRTDENEVLLECNYRNVREDNHKRRKTPHVCKFIKAPCANLITKYFQTANPNQIPDSFDDFNLDNMITKIGLLAGQQNLSLTFCESDEFYNFVTYTMAFGSANIDREEGDLIEQAKNLLPQYKRKFYRDVLVTTSRTIHQMTMKEFTKLDYVCVAIDQGSVLGRKNVDFVLENPSATMEPYPYLSLKISDQTAKGYAPILDQGLGVLELYKIKLGSVVADGNRAQKKCFDIEWDESLRRLSDHRSVRNVVFIPCLCHRIDNSLKYHINHDAALRSIVERLHQIACDSRSHKEIVGAICPSHVATRWIYDFDIMDFIRRHHSKIKSLTSIPEEFNLLHPVLSIFKRLVQIFESPRTFHFSAFTHIERGIFALSELEMEHNNPFAGGFRVSLENYTMHSKEAGIWTLSYLLTRKGHDDFHQRLKGIYPTPKTKWLNYFSSPSSDEADELDETIDDLLNDDIISDTPQDAPPVDNVEEEKEEETSADISEEAIIDPQFISVLESAKIFLHKQLMLTFGKVSSDNILKCFTAFIDDPNPFCYYHLDNQVGYSWKQIAMSFKEFEPIADMALRLHNSVCSEASCERTISAQKLILNARRKNSKAKLLNARLTLMRARVRK